MANRDENRAERGYSRGGEERAALARAQIRLLQTAEGFFASQVLFATTEMGVYNLLSQKPMSPAEVASAVGADPDATERVLNAAVAIGTLTIEGNTYSNSPLASEVLVADRPGYLGNWIRLMSYFARGWTHLTDSVRTGEAAEEPWLPLGKDPDYTRDFVAGMDDYARLRGKEVLRFLDLSGKRTMVDIGGGLGTYAILFAQQWPDLKVTVFDLPEVARAAQENVATSDVADRISVQAGNYHDDAIGDEQYDVAFISDTLHQETPEGCMKLLNKTYDALEPGGQLVVQAMFLNEDRVSPRWPVMVSLNLLVLYGTGRAYTVDETTRFVESAGFKECRLEQMTLLNVNSLLLAQKPGK
jgi:precorrin-6B methylase 2